MSLLTNVHDENKSERRLSVFIFNLIIFVMSFLILAAYTTLPFFELRAKANLTKEDIAELVQMENVEIAEEGVSIELNFVVPANVILDTSAKVLNSLIFNLNVNVNLDDTTASLIDENVNSLVDQLLDVFEVVAIDAAKQLAITHGKDVLLNELTQGDETKTAAFEQKLVDAGINDAYFEEKMEVIVSALQEEGATVDGIADTVVSVMESVVTDLQTKTDTDLHIDSINSAELKANVITALDSFKNEDGTINLEAAIAELLNTVLTEENQSAQSEVASLSDTIEETQPDSVEQLKANLRNKISGLLGDDVYAFIGNALRWLSLIYVLSMATWVYLMIKIIVKVFMKDNSIKFFTQILLGGLPGLLWLIPSITLHFLSKNPELATLPYNLELAFAASGWVAILGIFVLIIICGPYMALRKTLKGKKLAKFK